MWKQYKLPTMIATPCVIIIGLCFAFRGSSQGDLAGRVTCQGKPVAVGTVLVLAADGSLRCAPLDGEGRYHVAVPRGTVKIGVVSRDPNMMRERRGQLAVPSDRLQEADRNVSAPEPAGQWFAVPRRFEDPQFSGLETQVKKKCEFDIELQ